MRAARPDDNTIHVAGPAGGGVPAPAAPARVLPGHARHGYNARIAAECANGHRDAVIPATAHSGVRPFRKPSVVPSDVERALPRSAVGGRP